jgi:hypothetical protein
MTKNGNSTRKREIRAYMAETGLNYTSAMRIVDERHQQRMAERAAQADSVETDDAENPTTVPGRVADRPAAALEVLFSAAKEPSEYR